ncbi:MAG: hypothetical protein AAGD01_04650 [Acidobacteriota bacterium]
MIQEFVNALLEPPTVLFTSLLVVVVVYWLTVILGIFDLDLFDLDLDLDVGVDGAMEGVEGALELGDAPEIGDAGPTGVAGLLTALGLAGVPLTVTLSFLIVFSWFLTYQGMRVLPLLDLSGGLIRWLLLPVVSVLVSLGLTSVLVRPLRPVFRTVPAASRQDFSGRSATVVSSHVDREQGRAEIDDGGAGLLVEARLVSGAPALRGDQVTVVRYDNDLDVFFITRRDESLQ